MTAIISAVIQFILSFITGSLFGKKSSGEKTAEEAVEDYRKGEKIDAMPDVDGSSLREFFNRVRK